MRGIGFMRDIMQHGCDSARAITLQAVGERERPVRDLAEPALDLLLGCHHDGRGLSHKLRRSRK